jgi:hypothetical protein
MTNNNLEPKVANDSLTITGDSSFIHKLLLDKKCFHSKPEINEIPLINNRIVNHPVDIHIIELSNQVTSPNGKSWIPAYLEGVRKNEGWRSQSVFALDFDNKDSKKKLQVDNPLSFKQLLERLKDYGLDCAFTYTTFSHTDNWHKYRVVFQINEPVVDKGIRDAIQNALMMLFPECDKGCRDASRIFFGGKDILYTNYDYYLDLSLLFQAAEFCAIKASSSQNMKRDLVAAKRKLRVSKNEANTVVTINNTIAGTANASKITIIDNVNWNELRSQVKILDDFMTPYIKLADPHLFGLATNLRFLRGGQDLYKECLRANPEYNYEEKVKKLQYCKIQNYSPMRLDLFSPYEEDHVYKDILEAAKKKKIVRLKPYHSVTISEARLKLKEIFKDITHSSDTDVHVLKVPTGLGKTQLCTGLTKVVLAFPNHALKSEMSQRMSVAHRLTPSDDNLPDEAKRHLKYLYSIGAKSEASRYLAIQSQVDENVENYCRENIECYSSSKTVLTTHQKALLIEWRQHDTIIFDEDVVSSLLPTNKLSISDLIRLESRIGNKNDKGIITRLIDDIRNGRVDKHERCTFELEDISAIEDEVLDNKYESNVLQFFHARFYVVDAKDANIIHFIRKYDLPQDKKVIILSATVDETIYKKLVGDRLKFYDISNVETTGAIIQDSRYSFSRASLKINTSLEYVADVLKQEQLPTITFSSFNESLKALGVNVVEEMYFGKTTGFDALKGQNIAVVGTPHVNPITIALYAKLLGMSEETTDFKAFQQTVEHNGFRFWFNTYENQNLRNLQFFFIESELRQAIGRARVNTELCNVLVYSNYPLPEACVTEEEKSQCH